MIVAARLIAAVAGLIAAALLAGCGGDGDDDGSLSDRKQILDALEATLTSTDPANCTRVQTQRFLEQTQYNTGRRALESCRENVSQPTADSVSVSDVRIDSAAATATAGLSGGAFDRQTLEISLVDEDGTWKLDQIDDIPGFDADRYADAFIASSTEGPLAIKPDQAACVAEQIRSRQPEELKRVLLSGDRQQLVPLYGPCL